MTIFSVMRIKNEARWIEQVVRSVLPTCERMFILSDHSTDFTEEICERIDERVTVIRSEFDGLNEARDKTYLLQRAMNCVSDVHLRGNPKSPYWVISTDGDEVLDADGPRIIRETIADTAHHAFKLGVKYLWGDRNHIRVDGVYQNFARPSIFRLFNRNFQYQSTPWGNGANFHCSSIPQELLHCAHQICPAPLWHLGYMNKEDRIRKWKFYNAVDPFNEAEDKYSHCVAGDLPQFPADMKMKWAGPLRREEVQWK